MHEPVHYPSLTDKVVFITWWCQCIGAAMVTQFCAQGAKVAFIDFDESSGLSLQNKIRVDLGVKPWFEKVDVTNISALQSSILTASQSLGPIMV